MKKALICMMTVILIITAFVSCEKKDGTQPNDICGTYVRKNSNEYDSFTITLNEEGTYSYFETMISSHIGFGEYTVDGEKVTLVDSQIPGAYGSHTYTFTFKYEDDKLVYLADESDHFMYINLPDGAEFERVAKEESEAK